MVTVAKSHPVLAEKKTIRSVNFQVDGGPNRMENKVSGKGKRVRTGRKYFRVDTWHFITPSSLLDLHLELSLH